MTLAEACSPARSIFEEKGQSINSLNTIPNKGTRVFYADRKFHLKVAAIILVLGLRDFKRTWRIDA
jgi:hypothetical protein